MPDGPAPDEQPTDGHRTDGTGGAREQIMRGTLRCVERSGVRGFSLEDVAREAGLSRTSIYRHFPDGRRQLIQETATWEVGRFWARLAEAVEGLGTLEDRLAAGLMLGARQISESRIMANLMDPDLDVLVDALQPAQPLVQAVIRDYMETLLDGERDAGRLGSEVEIPDAADYLTRMIVSVMTSPAGLDLTDETQARELVRRQFTAGILQV